MNRHGRFYVGSTSISASKPEFNRMGKLKQTLSDSAAHVVGLTSQKISISSAQ